MTSGKMASRRTPTAKKKERRIVLSASAALILIILLAAFFTVKKIYQQKILPLKAQVLGLDDTDTISDSASGMHQIKSGHR
jgi:hypothetical protein